MPKKLIYGVGVNDSPEPIAKSEVVNGKSKQVWRCPIYTTWRNILERCYSEKFLDKFPSYIGTTIHEDWKSFTNFKSWVVKQNYKDRDIDKDLLIPGNKHYSPQTCIFVPHEINTLILKSEKGRGEYAIGVSYVENRDKHYHACIHENHKKKHLGCFYSEFDAHRAWQNAKIEITERLIIKYTGEIDLVNVLTQYKNSILDDLTNNRYTE
jgi:hypothetical protein